VSIDKLPSGKYRVRWRDTAGKPHSKAFLRQGEAREHERGVYRLKANGRLDNGDADLQTLAELAAEHMTAVAGELSAKTMKTYRDLWAAHVDARILDNERQWLHEIADTPLRLITAKVIEQWRDDRLEVCAKRLKRPDGGRQALRKTMALMQSMFDRAARDETITSNPVKLIRKPSGKSLNGATVIAPAAVEKIRAQLDDTGRMVVALLAQTGIRPGELRALRWEHIGQQSIRVEYGCNPDGTPKPTKTDHRRTVPLLATLAADLKAWKRSQGDPSDTAFIFPRTRRRRSEGGGECWSEDDWRNFERRHFKVAAADAGVPINRAYELRHSIASLWLLEGVNPLQVAQWLGHKPSETFGTYGKVLAELDQTDRTPAAERIAEARRVSQKCHSAKPSKPTEKARSNKKPRLSGAFA
jgi:integrase